MPQKTEDIFMPPLFVCTDCGYDTTKWSGKCPNCGSWDTIREAPKNMVKTKDSPVTGNRPQPERINTMNTDDRIRLMTGINEFDLVLGGGIIPGMVVLIGGEPGIGKSTLMLQFSQWAVKMHTTFANEKGSSQPQTLSDKPGIKVLYCSGEESADQINLRSKRIGVVDDNIWLLCTNDTEHIIDTVLEHRPQILVVDSIQSIGVSSLDSIPGSYSQIRESCNRLIRLAKEMGIALFIIGHVTKEGIVAGPKVIEHMVDTVLYFEGDLRSSYKILRAVKNRFGSTNEIGLFEMTAQGLMQVQNPVSMFLSHDTLQIGTALGCIIEGTRSFIAEVQTLATSSSFGTPQRVVVGLEQKRIALLLAIMEKNLALYLRTSDVFVNLTGGIRTIDPSLDLAIVAAIMSSLKDKPLPQGSLYIGELSLSGEIRPVSQLDKRIAEAIKLGYDRIYISDYAKIRIKNKVVKVKDIKSIYSTLV